MGDVTVRDAAPGDMPAMRELLAARGYAASVDRLPERLAAMRAEGRSVAMVATAGEGRVVGLITLAQFMTLVDEVPASQASDVRR